MSRALALFLAIMAMACTADNGGKGFFILNNSAPPMGMCSFSGTLGQAAFPSGQVSTLSPGYLFNPLMQSKLTTIMNQDPAIKTIIVQGAKIQLNVVSTTLIDANGNVSSPPVTVNPNLLKFQQLASNALTPNGGTANVSFDLIPAEVIAGLAGTHFSPSDPSSFTAVIEAIVSMYGEMGGGNVDADPFTYGVTLCNHCGVNVIASCPAIGASPAKGNPCNQFQDGAVDCCCKKQCATGASKNAFCVQDGDCGAGTCSITTTKTCNSSSDCIAGTDGVCVFPNKCNPGDCVTSTAGLVCPANTM
jgi:hypothetical protein